MVGEKYMRPDLRKAKPFTKDLEKIKLSNYEIIHYFAKIQHLRLCQYEI